MAETQMAVTGGSPQAETLIPPSRKIAETLMAVTGGIVFTAEAY